MDRRQLIKNCAASSALFVGQGLWSSMRNSRPVTASPISSRLPKNAATDPRLPARLQAAQDLVNSETKTAVAQGLRFLKSRQVISGDFTGAFGNNGYASGTAVTALAGLAFMCSGSTPFDGPYASHIRKCTQFLLAHTSAKGYIASPGNRRSNMYGHGYGMLFLSQVYGMSGSPAVEATLRRAVTMTCNVQNDKGGWRYQPTKQEGDLSITICQIMALRAAHDAGMSVSAEVRDRTLEYVYKSQKKDGSFQYMLRGGRVSLALTAAGVVSLYSAGVYDGEPVEKALKWIFARRPRKGLVSSEVSSMNYYYAHYYAVQAMWHAQIQHPEYWNQWYPAVRDQLLERATSGVWDDPRICPEFATAMACIILQIPFNYLPVFTP